MSGSTPESSILYQDEHIQIKPIVGYPGQYWVRFADPLATVRLPAAALLALMDAALLHAERFKQEVEQAQKEGGEM